MAQVDEVLPMEDKDLFILHNQYHGWWCSGDTRNSQDIGSHDIDWLKIVCFSTKRVKSHQSSTVILKSYLALNETNQINHRHSLWFQIIEEVCEWCQWWIDSITAKILWTNYWFTSKFNLFHANFFKKHKYAPELPISFHVSEATHFIEILPQIRQFPGHLTLPISWLLTAWHYSEVIMSMMESQITGVSIVRLTVCSGTDKRKH